MKHKSKNRPHRVIHRVSIFFSSIFLLLLTQNCTHMQPNQHSQPKFTNHLANELSPYLLQHAHNPVNWYPWSEEALNKAKTEDKPILISIGYAACHWCHVMEREAFENEEIAQYMNQHFVNIKVDREERPDLDNIYMDAVTTLTGSGGWPLNCFLTPEAKPFYGGTYFPPKPMYGKPDWLSLLKSIVRTFAEKRNELEQQAEQLTQHILQQDTAVFQNAVVALNTTQLFETGIADTIYLRLKQRFDTEDGGFGAAPKFPGTMNLQWLLQYHYFSDEKGALQHTLFSLDKMTDGGIYDHLGGGFSRYSVDKAWLVPHFEKMLYDNALLTDLLTDAYKITQKPEYKETLEQTLGFIAREMTTSEGGFYSSYDADSEGEEGKYYVWSKKEIEQILSDDAPIFNRFYGVTDNGNWEGKNILNRQFAYKTFADKTGYSTLQLKNLLQRCQRRLIAHRDDRIKPALDDKILLGWNALMTTAYSKAYQALGNEEYKKAAETNLQFMLTKFADPQNAPALLHTYKNGRAQYPAFLDDYAFLIEALLAVYQINFDEKLPQLALTYTEFVEQHFTDASGSAILFYTPDFQTDIIARKKEYYDSATPSGNATMAANLKLLGTILNRPDFIEKSAKMLKSIETSVLKYPSSFGKWGSVMLQFIYPSREVAILGNNAPQLANQLSKSYLPNLALMAATDNLSPYELLQDRYVAGKNLIYVCENNACKMPVSQPSEALKLIDGRLK